MKSRGHNKGADEREPFINSGVHFDLERWEDYGIVRFCILVPRALNITHVIVSSYIQERKENRCESKSRVKSRWSNVKIVFIYHVSYGLLLVCCHCVVNKGCRLSPSAWLWFLCFGIHCTLCSCHCCTLCSGIHRTLCLHCCRTLCLCCRRALCLAFMPLCSPIPSCVL